MTDHEIEQVHTIVRAKWPKVKWAIDEWAEFDTGCARIPIDLDSAREALGNLKRNSEKYPTVAGLLKALSGAIQKFHKPGATPTGQVYTRPEIERDQDGLTSFERRVIDDPKFRVFARRAGRLPPERERMLVGEIDQSAGEGNP